MKRVALALLAGLLAVTLIFVLGPWQDDPVLDAEHDPVAATSSDPTAHEGEAEKGDETGLVAKAGDDENQKRESLDVSTIELRGRLVDHEGKPVAGTEVELRLGKAVSSPWVVFNNKAKPADETTRTDGGGAFRFDVPVGKDGWITLGDEDLVWKKKAPRFLGSEKDLALGDLRVAVGARLVGRVVNENDAPLEGVTLMYSNYEAWTGRMRQTKSDRDGLFTLRGLSSGPSYLNVTRGGYVGFHRQYDLALGETRRDLVLKMRGGAVILGKVVDDRGQPIEGARITAHGNGRSLKDGGYEYSNCNTKTDAKGEFRATGLGHGPFNFTVSAKGHVQANKQKVKPDSGPLHFQLMRTGTIVGQIVDERGDPVGGGRVYSTTKPPKDGSRSNVERHMALDVAMLDGSIVSHSYNHGNRGVKVDDAGKFELASIKPGRIWLVANGQHKQAVHGSLEITAGHKLEAVVIKVKRGGVVTVTVLDPDGNPIEGARVKLTPKGGKANNGLPTNAVVALEGAWADSRMLAPSLVVNQQKAATGKTDAEGKCEIAGLEPGAFKASATQKQWVAPKSKAVDLGKSLRASVELRMVAGGQIALRIVDASGKPVAEQSFRIQRPARPGVDKKGKPFQPSTVKNGRADATGRATFGPLAPGHYEAVVMANTGNMGHMAYGWSSYMNVSSNGKSLGAPVPFRVEPGKTVEVVLEKPRLATLVGTVRNPGGPVRNARVVMVPARDKKKTSYFNLAELGASKRVNCGPNGDFRIENLQPGAYDVAVLQKKQGYQFLFRIDVVGTTEQRKDFFLATGEIEVKLTLDGEPVKDVSVQLNAVRNDASNAMMYLGSQSKSPMAKTDASGVARFPGIPASHEYRIRVSSREYTMPKQQPFRVEPAGSVQRTIAIGRAARIAMTILKVGDEAVKGSVRVEMKPSGDGKTIRRWVSSTGKPVTQSYPAGAYQVRAQRHRDERGKRGGWSQWQPVVLTPGKTTKVRIIVP